MIFYTKFNENSKHSEEHDFAYTLLSEVFKTQFGIINYTIKKSDAGKPFLSEYPDLHFNISHCSGLAVCGVSDVPIGVDAELVRKYNSSAMRIIFSQCEREFVNASKKADNDFFRIWTLKECYGKCLGNGIFPGISEYSFDLSGDVPFCVKAPEKVFTQKLIDHKWIISVCSDNPENEFRFIPLSG